MQKTTTKEYERSLVHHSTKASTNGYAQGGDGGVTEQLFYGGDKGTAFYGRKKELYSSLVTFIIVTMPFHIQNI